MMKQLKPLAYILFVYGMGLHGCSAQPAVDNTSLQLVSSVPLPGVKGRIDHLAYDSRHGRVYIAALGNNSVEVVDIKSGKLVHSIKELQEPQGIVFIGQSNAILVANGNNGICDIFSAETFQKISSVQLTGDADNVRYDIVAQKIYVGYGNGSIAVIDAASLQVIADIPLDGHPESFQLDKTANRIYVNVPGKQQIEVIDLTKNTVVAKWKITAARSNFPMSLDEESHRLFVGCRNPSLLLVMDTKTGSVLSSYAIDSDTDDIFYSKPNKQLYISCGGGYIDIFKQSDPDRYDPLPKTETHAGARTSLYVPDLNELIIASPSGFGREASLSIYKIKTQ